MKISTSPITLAVLIALHGCITTSTAPGLLEQNNTPGRIEQVYVDGRLQFVVCYDCPMITPKQIDGDDAATASASQPNIDEKITTPEKQTPTVPTPEEAVKKISEWNEKDVVQALINGSLYTLPETHKPEKGASFTGPNKTELFPKTDDARNEPIQSQGLTENKKLVIENTPGALPEKETADPVKILAKDYSATSKELAVLVNFDFNQKQISEDAAKEIEKVLPLAMSATKIVLNGYTDSVGSKAYNDVLAMQRAINTKQALRRKGIEIDIDVSGEGNCCYLANNDTEEGRAKNRRVEISVIDKHKRQTAKASKVNTENQFNPRPL